MIYSDLVVLYHLPSTRKQVGTPLCSRLSLSEDSDRYPVFHLGSYSPAKLSVRQLFPLLLTSEDPTHLVIQRTIRNPQISDKLAYYQPSFIAFPFSFFILFSPLNSHKVRDQNSLPKS